MSERTYIAIDLKSFYASVECADRSLDPLNTHLVVADASRTEKTICLAVSPALKACGIPGRARLFEVIEKVREANLARLQKAPRRRFSGKSYDALALAQDPSLKLDFVVAVPRMARYMEVSSQIYGIYLKFVAPEDIHVYSIDEVFIDATGYLNLYRCSAREFAMKLIREVLHATNITATAGIGTNLYLAKIAMDIEAKHIPPDQDGVRIAELDERSYREKLWSHRPLSDFWRIGHGYATKLEAMGLRTMGEIARLSEKNEELLYRKFGVNAELLIDHAWGWEPCTIRDIQSYQPENRSVSSGQVLQEPYSFSKARLVVWEMTDQLALDLVEKKLVTDQLILNVNFEALNGRERYSGAVRINHYGKTVPQDAHGSIPLSGWTASGKRLTEAMMKLFDAAVDPDLLVRKITVGANHVLPESEIPQTVAPEQPDLFGNHELILQKQAAETAELAKEKRLQLALLAIKRKHGKNAILKGANLLEGATMRERNNQIGGHKK